MELTNEQMIELTEKYANEIVDGMEMDELLNLEFESVMDRLRETPDADVLSEISQFAPNLLEKI